MKKGLIVLSFLLGALTFAQDVKIKKGDLLIDEKVVAKVNDKDWFYNFSTLDGNLMFTVKKRGGETPDQKGWLEFKGANGNIKEVDFDAKSNTMSVGKTMAKNAMVLGLITANGIDEEKVKEFFQTEDLQFSGAKAEAEKSLAEENKKEDSIAFENKVAIDKNGSILWKRDEKIGSIEKVLKSKGMAIKYYEFVVYDNNKKQIANLPFTDMRSENAKNGGLFIETIDGKKLPFDISLIKFGTSDSLPINLDDAANRVVKKLFANGYLK